MTKYQSKSIVVEAIQFDGNFDEIEAFVGGDSEWRDGYMIVATVNGSMQVRPTHWVIKHIDGKFYTCRPDVFAETFKVMDSEPIEHHNVFENRKKIQ